MKFFYIPIILYLFFGVILSNPFDGLFLISDTADQPQTELIDNNNNIINTWYHDTRLSGICYLTNDSLLYFVSRINNNQNLKSFKIMDWNSQIIWEYALSDDFCRPHHDIEVLPNGNILSICGQRKSLNDLSNIGMLIDNNQGEINRPNFDTVIEIEPIGSSEANIVWEWYFWDHLIQDVDSNLSNYGIISQNPQLLDINSPAFDGSNSSNDASDWTHCNSIDYNQSLDQILLSCRHKNEIYIIDHSTTTLEASSSSGGYYNKGGDFLYRWGNPQNYDRGLNSNQILYGQHGANWISEDYPGAGNLIIFNNFHNNENNSSVIEITTPINDTGMYLLDSIDSFQPLSYGWIYENNFFSGTRSGAYRLPNGNTIISSFQDAIFEIDSLGQIVWEYEGELVPSRVEKYSSNYFNTLIGDINNDEFLNVLDVVMLVNLVMEEDYNDRGDINQDGILNVLDVVILVNIVLNGGF